MGNEDCNSTIHGTGSPYFLKIMLADFAQKLRIPPLFVPRLIKENSENMILQGPGARQWTVKLWGNSTRLEFRQGWKFFVQDHTVEAGDILVFKYISESYFKVRIFGRNGCEKNIINFGKSDKRCGDTSPASQLPVALDCEEEMNGDHTEAAAQKGKKLKSFSDDHLPKDPKHFQPSFAENEHDTRKSAKAEQTSCGKLKLHYVSGRRPATEIERNKALEAANTFTSDKPFCLMVLKPSHLYKGHWLNFPRGYEDRLKLPKERREVVLLDPNNNEWHVQYVWSSRNIGALSSGWKSFSFVNNLEVGDICIFERADEGKINIKLRVHIFRVAMKYGPHKRVEGRGMDDCLSLPLNHSNKKMKVGREDLPINLTAKSSDPEEGKIAKQVQEKKEKASTESNYLKMKKLKSFSDDHLPKDPKHFQPSFVGNEHDTRKYAEAEQTNFGKLKLHYVSGRRPATEIERNKALEAANTFTSDKPFCLIVLKPSHLYKGHWLNFPRGYEDRLKLPKERREVVLLDPNSNEWHVQYVWSSRNIGALSSGWKSFSLVNNLEVGDICIFERADEGKINIKLRVHIFRVAMKYGPHKRVEGRGMDDCLPLPLNHSNKKMKVGREDLPINLTAKSSDPEEGKIAKQVQEKKEKASTYLKMDKSKCTLSPWERKTACRSSLRLAMKCNPVKSSKKELLSLCPSSSEEGQKAIGRDTMVPDPDVSVKEEVLMNISESNDEPHAMPPRSGQLHPSQGPLPEVPLMTNSMCFQMNLEGEASSLGVALSPEEAIFVVDISSSDTEN